MQGDGSGMFITAERARSALHYAFCLVLILLIYGHAFPWNNEWLYMLNLQKAWHPDFLLNDWTFAYRSPEHVVFNAVFGIPLLVLSMETYGWIGRLLVWTLNLYVLFRLGRRFSLPKGAVTLGIAIWLSLGQSLVGYEWLIWGFEAKTVAYPLLLLSLERFLDRKAMSAGALLGLAFSMHPAVGMWGGLAIAFALPFNGYKLRELMLPYSLVILFALPGAIPLLIAGRQSSDGLEECRFLSLTMVPFHLDPATWARRDILTLYLMFIFNWLHYRLNREHAFIRLLAWFQAGTALFFTIGLLLRYTESYRLLVLMPFRIFPLLSFLFFFFALAHAFLNYTEKRIGLSVALVGLLALMGLGSPVSGVTDRISGTVATWKAKDDDTRKNLKWIRANTPEGAVVIMPPWRDDGWYYSHRAQIVEARFFPYGRIREWKERLESFMGPLDDQSLLNTWPEMEKKYSAMTVEKISWLKGRYGAGYLLTDSDYPFQLVSRLGASKVYRLDTCAPGKTAADGKSCVN